jgi:septum formation protein
MLKERLKKYNIILASGSPRRQQLLKDLNLDFSIQLKEIEENFPSNLKGSEITDYLAKLKSTPFQKLKKKDILITSDTIVWLHNKAIGKPKSKIEAIEIFNKLSGNMHQVITSVCIKTTQNIKIFNDTTNVFFKTLTDEEINYYIDNFSPYDKAGGYGVQDWIGYIGVEKIEGSFYNVMGFPIHKFYQEMLKF